MHHQGPLGHQAISSGREGLGEVQAALALQQQGGVGGGDEDGAQGAVGGDAAGDEPGLGAPGVSAAERSAKIALAGAGSIVLVLHMGWGEVDVPGGGIHVGVPEEGLHHRQIHPGLSQGGPEGVP